MKTLTFSRVSSGVVATFLALAAIVAGAALIARADTAPTITNAIQNGSNTTITTAPIGTAVHNTVTVASSTSSTTPTGTVDFNRYDNMTCSGTPTVQSGVALVNGVAQSATTTVLAGGLSYLVHYNGDASTTAANSACQALTATAANVTISTALSTSSVLAGSSVYDTATLDNETANATGTVAYNVYTNNLCTTGAQSAGTKTVAAGVVPNSDTLLFNTAGTFYWKAVYSGDQNNTGASSSCLPLQVIATSTPPVPPPATSTPGTISGNIFNDLNKNDVKDGSEVGLAGWKVWLHFGTKKDGYNDPIIATATTDANGNYSFPNLAVGKYFVEQEEQKGWKQTSSDMKVVLSASTTSSVVNFANIMKNATSTNGGNNGNGNGNGHHDDDDHGNKGGNGNHWGWFKNFFKDWNKNR